MAPKVTQLDLDVWHGSRREHTWQAAGDPRDFAWLQEQLRTFLAAEKWHESRWPEFELVARPAGRGDKLARVRA
jgi:hypothetical protein